MGLFESIRTLKWCQLLAGSLFALLFGWHAFQGDHLTALVYLCGLLVTGLLLITEKNLSKSSHSLLSRSLFIAYTFISLLLILFTEEQNTYLNLSLHLIYPLLAFSLLHFKTALIFVLLFSVSANLLLMLQLEGTFRAAYLTTFWLVTLLTSLHSFAHFTRQTALHKRLNRDPSTELLNKSQFLVDLPKEQERAEREATFLAVICLTDEKDFDLRTANEIADHFASYETLYSVTSQQLIALVPLANPKELKLREQKLKMQLPKLQVRSQLTKSDQPAANFLKDSPAQLMVAL